MNETERLSLVIFGASGDLTRRKLMPALIRIYAGQRSPDRFTIIGCARTPYTDQSYRAYLKEALSGSGLLAEAEKEVLDAFLLQVYYLPMDPADGAAYPKLGERLADMTARHCRPGNCLFYLATPPSLYGQIPRFLQAAGLLGGPGLKRIIVEKPFGYDLASAQTLNRIYTSCFREEDIYRIDHFLGKETVQSIMATRFGSAFYEPLWNRNHISHVEITAVENMGVGTRGGYYDGAGALRDMVQNHLMQLLAITAMEPPARFDKDSFRNEVVKVYRSLRPLSADDICRNVVRGQYLAGGDRPAYRDEPGVHARSRTETYVAMRLYIDNWRWKDVPFYIRTGKQMPTKVTEIVVHFKPAPLQMFVAGEGVHRDEALVIRIQPDEGWLQRVVMKEPGSGFKVGTVEMDFSYARHERDTGDAYVRLLEDCLIGDPTLFTRADAVEESWRYFGRVLSAWEEHPECPLYGYPAGTWGPEEADRLIASSGAGWTNPCKNLTRSDQGCEL